MPPLDKSLLVLGTLCYVGASLSLLLRSLRARRLVYGGVLLPMLAGLALQGAGLQIRGLAVGGCPVGNPFETLQYISWTVVGLSLLLGKTFRNSLPGALAALLGAGLSAASLSVPGWDASRTPNLLGPNPWLEMHAALAVTSYGVFAALAVSSALHLHHYRNLKSRRPAATSGSLPSVRELDQLNFRLLSIATGILTLSMAIGSVFWFSAPQAVGGPKLLAATALWIASLVVVGLRLGRVAQGHRLSWCGILLFAAALASLWPVKHQRPADQVPHTVQRNG